MSLLSTLEGNVRCLADEDTDHTMLQDLQLAAELGKTLLERNKDLENTIRTQQSTIEEQAQEIEYMKKQTAALREVNDSRLKIYEQLEVSIQDLERAHHRHVVENTNDKKLIKSQCATIENLESRCEELQKIIDELTSQNESLQRQQQATSQSTNSLQPQNIDTWKMSITYGGIEQTAAPSPTRRDTYQEPICGRQFDNTQEPDEYATFLLGQLKQLRTHREQQKSKIVELNEQLSSVLQENSALEEQLNIWKAKAKDIKNLQDEISTLEEVRQGHLCGRCLRGIDTRTPDEISVMLEQEEDDDLSMAEAFSNYSMAQHDSSIVQDTTARGADEVDSSPYRVLVEKYEALLEVQRNPVNSQPRKSNFLTTAPTPATTTPSCMSLQEELEMSGEFNSFNTSSHHQDQKILPSNSSKGKQESANPQHHHHHHNHSKKPFASATPTDFSEAETSSSGFSDETSNKATQTDGRLGAFLCTIADGEDCKISIYDDNSPFESRFSKTPQYRQTFSEIFRVLKKADEAKEEMERQQHLQQHQLNDSSTSNDSQNTTQDENCSEITDDNQSVMSSAISSVVSEPVIRMQTPTPQEAQGKRENESFSTPKSSAKAQSVRRQPLEYLSIDVHVKKKNSAKRNSAKKNASKKSLNEKAADVVPTINPKILLSKPSSAGKKKFRPLTAAENNSIWNNGNVNHNGRRKVETGVLTNNKSNKRPDNNQYNNGCEYKEYKPSTASEEVARLRRLEMSYAEALRMSNKPKVHGNRRY